ncbi:MAG: outer membrane protein OmpK [Sulfurimonas sp.]|nr:outer membrane protein OmpK [Sulfurimonas sp.]
MVKLLYLPLLLSLSLSADPLYSFKSLSINYLDWTKSTEKKTAHKDFTYLKIDGGFGYEWIDFFGYISLENPTKSYYQEFPNNRRYVGFADIDIEIKNNFKLHIQDFYARSEAFSVNDFVVGFAYRYQNSSGFWIKPFLGLHFTNDTYFDGLNGFMGGWTFHLPWKLGDQKFALFQWNEIEFARDKKFYQHQGSPIGDSKSYGLNGAMSFWWYISDATCTGLEYRYAKHKLGSIEYQEAFVYNLKYYF